MAVETLYADPLGTSTGNVAGALNATDAPDGSWTQTTGATDWTHRWPMSNPSGTAMSGTHTVTVRAKKEAGQSGTPTIQVNLYNGSTLVKSLVATSNVTSGTGEDFSGTFTNADISTPNTVEIEVVATAAGGSPSTRTSVQVDAITWSGDFYTPQSSSGSAGTSGAGTLTAAGAPGPVQTVNLTGSGTLGGTGVGTQPLIATVTSQLYLGETPIGSPVTHTVSTSSTNVYTPFDIEFDVSGLTLAQIQSGNLNVRHQVTRTGANESATAYVDSVQMSVTALTATNQSAFDGTVALSGSGALTFVGRPSVARSGALSGSGTLTLTRGPVAVSGAAALSGSGTLGMVGAPSVARSGALSGSGTLTLAGVARPAQTVQLSGSGTLTAVGAPGQITGTVALSGVGTLALTRGPVGLSGTVALSGVGSLTLVPVVGFARSGALSGVGALSLVGIPGFSRSGALSGDGTLSLTKWFLFTANSNGGTATGTGWVNPENATGADNSAYASWTTDVSDAVSAPLVVSNFGTWSSIPAGSTIPKITVRVKGYVDHE